MVAKRALTMRPLPFLSLSTAVNMQVANAPARHATQRGEAAGVGLFAAPVLRCGPATSPCSHFATVLRESPVMREILRSDLFLRACKCRILPIMSMVITPCPLLHKKAAE